MSYNKAYIYIIYIKTSSTIFVNVLFNTLFSRGTGKNKRLYILFILYIDREVLHKYTLKETRIKWKVTRLIFYLILDILYYIYNIKFEFSVHTIFVSTLRNRSRNQPSSFRRAREHFSFRISSKYDDYISGLTAQFLAVVRLRLHMCCVFYVRVCVNF